MQAAAAPTSTVMDVLARIRLSMPKMREVWCQNSSMALAHKTKDVAYAKLLQIEEQAKSLIVQKVMTLQGPFDWTVVKDFEC